MKVSVNWLKEFVDTRMSIDALAHTLTMAGLEVEEVSPVAASFDHVVISEIKTIAPHPNADKLRVCEVDAGTGHLLQIVCGAPNVTPGMRVPCALVGARLPGLVIKSALLRGIESNGMLCSARELGLSEEHSGLLTLPNDAPVGQDIRIFLDLDDVYLTLKMTPNRGDCLSMIGVARDLAAVTGVELNVPVISPTSITSSVSRSVAISAMKACGRYSGRVLTGVDAGAMTPDWMKRRLERAGFRSVAPLIDITNYVNLERGQPMHAFDQDSLKGGIDVRFAKSGEELNLLNAQHVALQENMLVICDANGPVAIAGVMGGLESMVTEATESVFFESAYFDPDTIRGKTRTLAVNSDAAYRFERGVDPEGARNALERATQLALEICGRPGTATGPITTVHGDLPVRSAIKVRPSRVTHLLGMDVPRAEMIAILKRLHCEVLENGEFLNVIAPSFRFDLKMEEDFVEEVARINGYDKVPAKPPKSSLRMLPVSEGTRSRASLRRAMVDLGYQEVINYSFVPPEWELDFAGNTTPLRVANPISSQMSVMRTNLIGGLTASLKHNLNRGESRLKLFEVGRCFLHDTASLDAQPEMLGGLVYGARFPEQWGEGGQKGQMADFFSVKGDVETLLQGFETRFESYTHFALHPGRSASIFVAGKRAGMLGELHPKWQQKLGLPMAPFIFELNLVAMSTMTVPSYKPHSKMQILRRDIAILINDNVKMQCLIDAFKGAKLASIVDFSPFDIYRGESIGTGKKSVAFRILMQDTDRTLVDSEADKKVSEVLEVLSKEFGATLRK
ncbi:MAG: phenylalanine--tRNA ligase subunit beta [Burkholderiales bacterium]|nr:phenylalanine--tRNA ligase subunit beta [Burkholderiales bacterium]